VPGVRGDNGSTVKTIGQLIQESVEAMYGEGARVMAKRAENNGLNALRVFLAANVPVKLESLPGAGKTSVLNAMVASTAGFIKTMVAVNHDPTDFGGIPVPDLANDNYRLLPGEWVDALTLAVATYPITVLFLDEVNTAGRAVMAALLKVVDERIVGDRKLPADVRVVLAVNPSEANGGVDLPPAMANRVGHLPFAITTAAWADGLKSGFPAPDPLVVLSDAELAPHLAVYTEAVADFVTGRDSKEFVNAYPEDMAKRSNAWPSYRTWTLATRVMGASVALGMPQQCTDLVCEALVGANAGQAFADFMEASTSLDPAAVLANPNTVDLPEDDKLFTLLDRVVALALDKPTQDKVDAVCLVMVRLADEGRPGIAAGAMRSVAQFLGANRGYLQQVENMTIRRFRDVVDAMGDMAGDL
jgi:hypothetical protein